MAILHKSDEAAYKECPKRQHSDLEDGYKRRT